MDFITNLPLTENDNDTLFVVVDKFTEMSHLIPMNQTYNAAQVASLFKNNVYRFHGWPKIAVSDRDTRFTSTFWNILFTHFRTKLAMSTAHHPQTYRQTEIMNRITQSMLCSVLESDIDKWVKYIYDIEFAYNNSINQVTGFTPFYMNSGVDPVAAVSMKFPQLSKNNGVLKFIDHMHDIYTTATQKLKKAQESQQKYVNKKREAIQFNINKYVSLEAKCFHTLNRTHKLDCEYGGPFKICKKIIDNAFILYVTEKLAKYKSCNITSLKKYIGTPK